MASADIIGRADRASAYGSELKWVAGALVIGAIGFNAVLCFLNTRGVAISQGHVMISEMLLISAALAACRNYLNVTHVAILALVVLYTVTLSGLRFANAPDAGFDLKIIRDLIIPIIFFLLGRAVGDLKTADNVVFAATTIVLIFAVFEFFFLDAFLRVFEVAEYYIARGTLEASNSALDISEGLMASGVRPPDQGRTLLPFLGEHRVSSLFLEPISLGNFATIITLWAVIRSRMERRIYVFLALSGLALLVLSDGRFNAFFIILGVAILLVPPRITTLFVVPLPFILILALFCFGASEEYYYNGPPTIVEGLGVYDRVLYCARVLFYFDVSNWFGLEASRAQTFDADYAYVISGIGLIGFSILWFLFMSVGGANRYYLSFRNAAAVFFVALLCISNSPSTIKIGALLWFLLGVLSAIKGYDRIRPSARAVRSDRGSAARAPDLVPSLGGSTP